MRFGTEFDAPSAGRVGPAAARASPSWLIACLSPPVLRRMPSWLSPPVLYGPIHQPDLAASPYIHSLIMYLPSSKSGSYTFRWRAARIGRSSLSPSWLSSTTSGV